MVIRYGWEDGHVVIAGLMAAMVVCCMLLEASCALRNGGCGFNPCVGIVALGEGKVWGAVLTLVVGYGYDYDLSARWLDVPARFGLYWFDLVTRRTYIINKFDGA